MTSRVATSSNLAGESAALRNALLRQRYLLKDERGRVVETTRAMFTRVAKSVAAVEADYGATEPQVRAATGRFFGLMQQGQFLPNSPTLMNAGHPKGMLSACFVLGVDDSVDGIFEAVWQAALVQTAGGGTGFAFDSLRPAGDAIGATGGLASGPVTFWRVFAEATNAIQQGAHRRGANMGMMSVDHPDILKFITAKQDLAAFTNFNISVKVTDSFMSSLRSHPDCPHTVVNSRTGRKYWLPKTLNLATYKLQDLIEAGQTKAPGFSHREVWQMIVDNAYATGEPGICFIDHINRDNPTPALGRIEATNPCGEQPLLAGEACNLGSINVSRFVKPDGGGMDWRALGETVRWGVRFLDDVIDANHYPVPAIRNTTLGNRKIGLGIMGLADALILLGVRYDSVEGVAWASKLAEFIQDRAHSTSEQLAKERGKFPNWKGSIWDVRFGRPMRNASCTTIAPTGSISVIASCSSGIEPVYEFAHQRKAMDRSFIQIHPLLERRGRREGWLRRAVVDALLQGQPTREITGIPGELKKVLVTAHDVTPEWHIQMQAAVQKGVDSAVSKTVNLPAKATDADVDRIFRMAHELGCKGITVYRDGSRPGQTLSTARPGSSLGGKGPRPRSRVTIGRTSKYRMGCGTLFVTVNQDDKGLCEVFANLGKAGGCPSQSEATCRAVSAALRSGVNPAALIEQLRGIRCLSTCVARREQNGIDVLSCPDAIARAIEETMADSPTPAETAATGRLCPHCRAPMRREAGCFVCDQCIFNSCG